VYATWAAWYIATGTGRRLVEEELSSEYRSRSDRQSCISSPQLPRTERKRAEAIAMEKIRPLAAAVLVSSVKSQIPSWLSMISTFFVFIFVLFVCVFASSRLPLLYIAKQKNHGAIPSMPYAFFSAKSAHMQKLIVDPCHAMPRWKNG